MKFQHAYSEPVRTSDLECKDPSLAQQQFKDEQDINVMLERFKVTGQMPQNVTLPSYGDFRGVNDYRSAMEAVRKADNAFMDLPADLRAKFDNDPQKFLEFVADEQNRDEAVKLGLVKAVEAGKPLEVTVVGGIGGAAPDVNGSQVVTPSGANKP